MRIHQVMIAAATLAAVIVAPARPALGSVADGRAGHHHGHHTDSDGYGPCSYHFCRHYPYGHRERTRHWDRCDEDCGDQQPWGDQ